MQDSQRTVPRGFVAPFTGAWIEIGAGDDTSRPSPSLPSRERGLKFVMILDQETNTRSLPSQERGLKFQRFGLVAGTVESLPSRERGLKSLRSCRYTLRTASLPSRERGLKYYTYPNAKSNEESLSLPSRERGLKSRPPLSLQLQQTVAPFTGAWIEMPAKIFSSLPSLSLPSRERGLKYILIL